MATESDFEPTQTQSQSDDINAWVLVENPTEAWGKLITKNKALSDHDLTNNTFTAGRSHTGNCVFKDPMPSKLVVQLSKIHFKITRDLNEDNGPVYIEDLSRNGTYINGEKLGQGNKRILAHKDTIAVAHAVYKVFEYRNSCHGKLEIDDKITKKYHIVKKLGEGACGKVYLGYNCRTCLPYAIKHIKKHQMNGYKKNIAMNEGAIMKSIKHPCVVKMHDVEDSEDTDSMYIILEYMEGGDLLTRILSNKFLPEKTAKLFFYQICHAIKYLHERNITHRDLKPDNILLASCDVEALVKISDFGLSKWVQNNSVLRTMCGTPHYVAPEVLITQGRGEYTKKVDVWSLGVVLFTCLSGTLPFSNEYGTLATEQIKKADFKFRSKNWDHVSSTAKRLICNLLTVDAGKRPSIDTLVNHEWFDDYEMKLKAHKIMNISPPRIPRPMEENVRTFAIPGRRVEEIVLPRNDENAQPMKRRRLY